MVAVADGVAFQRLIERAVQDGFRGSLTRAGRASGLEESQLSRWRRTAPATLRPKTVEGVNLLLRKAGLDPTAELEGILLTPFARTALRAMDAWIRQSRRRLLNREGDRFEKSRRGYRLVGHAAAADARREDLWAHFIEALVTNEVKVFVAQMRTLGHSGDRIVVAIFRLIEPLLDAPESGFVERARYELTDKEFKAFLKAGITREKILLDRSRDQQRAQRLSPTWTPQLEALPAFELDRAQRSQRGTLAALALGQSRDLAP